MNGAILLIASISVGALSMACACFLLDMHHQRMTRIYMARMERTLADIAADVTGIRHK